MMPFVICSDASDNWDWVVVVKHKKGKKGLLNARVPFGVWVGSMVTLILPGRNTQNFSCQL